MFGRRKEIITTLWAPTSVGRQLNEVMREEIGKRRIGEKRG
jgi:hypothetical protein